MIAKLNLEKCPFRKKIVTTTETPHTQEESFLECLRKDCLAWGQKERACLLMRKEDKKED